MPEDNLFSLWSQNSHKNAIILEKATSIQVLRRDKGTFFVHFLLICFIDKKKNIERERDKAGERKREREVFLQCVILCHLSSALAWPNGQIFGGDVYMCLNFCLLDQIISSRSHRIKSGFNTRHVWYCRSSHSQEERTLWHRSKQYGEFLFLLLYFVCGMSFL